VVEVAKTPVLESREIPGSIPG